VSASEKVFEMGFEMGYALESETAFDSELMTAFAKEL
jgi:hypothetical protein